MRQRVIYETDSEYGNYQVVDMTYDDRRSRVLYGPGHTPQSGLALDDNPELLFNYNQRTLEVAQSVSPARVLVLGGGALTLPAAITQQFPDAVVDVVEINPLLPELASEFFDYIPNSRLNVYIQDGIEYMLGCEQEYDMIVIDVFSGRDIVTEFFTDALVARYRACLSSNGVVLVNFISRYFTGRTTLAHEMSATFSQVFPSVELYPADHTEPKRHEQNIVLIAADTRRSYDYLQSVPVELRPVYDV